MRNFLVLVLLLLMVSCSKTETLPNGYSFVSANSDDLAISRPDSDLVAIKSKIHHYEVIDDRFVVGKIYSSDYFCLDTLTGGKRYFDSKLKFEGFIDSGKLSIPPEPEFDVPPLPRYD